MQMAIIADDLTGALDAGVCMLPSDIAVATSPVQAEKLLGADVRDQRREVGVVDPLPVGLDQLHGEIESVGCSGVYRATGVGGHRGLPLGGPARRSWRRPGR